MFDKEMVTKTIYRPRVIEMKPCCGGSWKLEIRFSEELLQPQPPFFVCKKTFRDTGTLRDGVYVMHKLHLRTGETWTNWMFWGVGVSGRLEESWTRGALRGLGVLVCFGPERESSSRY